MSLHAPATGNRPYMRLPLAGVRVVEIASELGGMEGGGGRWRRRRRRMEVGRICVGGRKGAKSDDDLDVVQGDVAAITVASNAHESDVVNRTIGFLPCFFFSA